MLFPLDGPALQDTLTVNTTVVQEVKVGSSALAERKVVTIQPIDGRIYLYFGDGISTPNAATLQNDGMLIFKDGKESYEASAQQPLFILSVSGTVNVKIVERA